MKLPFMLSCKSATQLMEKAHTVGLTRKEKWQLWMHTKLCDACRQYERQSRFLEQLFQRYLGMQNPRSPAPPDDKLEARILQKLKERS
ncbi:MAG TPA: hypothetical protein PKC76_18290 [Saprospiraceae bacterium]|nr:hypothetical protein [Saprospiraceae bacterium]HMP26084.1 hypothetical protein [Saprospiraceae bacterium]